MLDTEFLEQVQEVIAACTHPDIQKAVFSATLPANAEKVAMSMLRDPIRVVVGLKYVPLNDVTILVPYSLSGTRLSPSLLNRSHMSPTTSRNCLHCYNISRNRTIPLSSFSYRPSPERRPWQKSLLLAAYQTSTAYTQE